MSGKKSFRLKIYIYVYLVFYILFPTASLGFAQEPLPSTYPPGEWETIIEGQVFTETLRLDSGDDNTLIIDAVFHSIDDHALMIRNVSNVYIKNCTIYDVDGFGILLRGTGSTNNVTIEGCRIFDTGGSGIMVSQDWEEGIDHQNLVIRNNTIFNNGRNEHEHNIYVQSTDSLIENNIVSNSSGNGISIRSTGIVRNNTILNPAKSCIRYYNDHASGPSDTLIIEGNFCQLSSAGLFGSPALSLLQSPQSPTDWLAENYFIRGNTIVLNTAERFGFEVESAAFDEKNIAVYDNLIINTEDVEKSISTKYVDRFTNNRTSTSLIAIEEDTLSPDPIQVTNPVSDEDLASDCLDALRSETANCITKDELRLWSVYLIVALFLWGGIILWIQQKRRLAKHGT